MINTAVIGLGSNIHPQTNIRKAKNLLARKYSLVAESRFLKTKPIGMTGQPYFLNGAVLIHTTKSMTSLHRELKMIEQTMGRPLQHQRFASRTIDLDILTFNGAIISPDFQQRSFVRRAVLELLPGLG